MGLSSLILKIRRTEELAKYKRKKVPLGWNIFSKEATYMLNKAIDMVNKTFRKANLPALPASYKSDSYDD